MPNVGLPTTITGDRDVAAAVEYAKAHLEMAREDRDIPGLSSAIAIDGETVWAGGFGLADAASDRPAGAGSIYPLASITKVVTCTALMRLRDAGKLQLDDPLSKYIGELPVQRPSADTPDPTLRQIASHTAGFQRETQTDAWDTLVFPSIDEVLGALDQCRLIVPPLTEHKYSNLAYALLGHVVSLVSGKPYVDYVAETILEPLAMSGASFAPEGERSGRVVTCYPWSDEDGTGDPAPPMEVGCYAPVGGLYASVTDIARFAAFHIGCPENADVLLPPTVKEMQTLQWTHPDWSGGHGIGWGVGKLAGKVTIGHSGGLPGLSTDLRIIPELKLAVAVFTNGGGAASAVATETLELLVPAVERARKRRKPKAPKTAPDEWRLYEGVYQSAMGNDKLALLIVDGMLLARSVGGPLSEVIPLKPTDAPHVFTVEGGGSKGEPVVFVLDEAGQVGKLTVGGYPYLAT